MDFHHFDVLLLFESFINGCYILSNDFSVPTEMIIHFLCFNVLCSLYKSISFIKYLHSWDKSSGNGV